jgi:hypothetical protein
MTVGDYHFYSLGLKLNKKVTKQIVGHKYSTPLVEDAYTLDYHLEELVAAVWCVLAATKL